MGVPFLSMKRTQPPQFPVSFATLSWAFSDLKAWMLWQDTHDLLRTRVASGSEKNSVISGGTYDLGKGVDVGPNLATSQSTRVFRS